LHQQAVHQPDRSEALFNPRSVYTSPEEVRDSSSLSSVQKRDILRTWEYDALELAVADDEGMRGDDSDILRRVLLAVDSVSGGLDVEHVGPTQAARPA
jgi:hypothetical protein